MKSLGLPGIGLLMLLENVFPPIPSELIMPLAGYLSTGGGLSFWGAVVAGSVGSLLGALFWYWVGRKVSEQRLRSWTERHGAWLAMTPDDIDTAKEWFERHGSASVFFGRLVPVVRTLISVPAGFSGMGMVPFLMYSALGTALWTAALAYAGRLLGAGFPRVGDYIGPATWVVVGAALAWYIVRLVRLKRER